MSVAAAAGVGLVAIADRLSVPSIALLLVGGVLLGPEMLGWVDPDVLGPGLGTVVSLAVAVILFEGGLTLDLHGFRRASDAIRRMLTIGVMITWIGTTAAIYAVLDVSFTLALLGGSLVIVTGPTVISPLLRRIGVKDRVHHVLYWEAVLIDAVGVFIAALCYEWITAADNAIYGPVLSFALRVLLGMGVGAGGGFLLATVLRRNLVSQEHANIVVLSFALLFYGVCEAILHESGILAVIVAGLTVRTFQPPQLARLKRFKLELTELGIGLLFILLSARLELGQFQRMGYDLVWLLLIVLFVVRPLDVFVSTAGQRFSLRERVFLSWIAPRGIVAAAMASLFALKLRALGVEEAHYLETFTFGVIATTVLLQGLSAKFVARLLKLEKPPRSVWMLTGDPTLGCAVADALTKAGAEAVVVDPRVDAAHGPSGETAVKDSPLARDLVDDARLLRVGAVLALSGDGLQDRSVCRLWGEAIPRQQCYRMPNGVDDTTTNGTDGEPADGVVVWQQLPNPHELVHALERNEAALSVVDASTSDDSGRFHANFAPLLAVSGGLAKLVPDPDRFTAAPGQRLVVLRRRVPGLAGLVRAALVVPEGNADLAEVVRRLLELAKREMPDLPADELLTGILERERSMSTAMGLGVIIPHTYHQSIPRTQCLVANVCCGLRSDAPGGELIHLVFLVLSPMGEAEAHLHALAAIARLVSDSDYRRLLGRQKDGDRLLELVRERE